MPQSQGRAIDSITSLGVHGIETSLRTPRGTLRAVDGLSLKVSAGIVGAVFLLIFSLSVGGDSLRDALDPRVG